VRAAFVVFTGPESNQKEAEYNEWYNNIHIPAILKLDGFVRASRWKLSPARPPADALAERQYLAIYELDTDNVDDALKRLKEAGDAGELGNHAGLLSRDPPTMTALFELLTEFES
jgi:hypothetical protein